MATKKLEDMSDDELDFLVSEEKSKSLNDLSDEQLDELVAKETTPIGQPADLGLLDTVIKVLDYPEAPVRETIGSAVDILQGKEAKNPLRFLSPSTEDKPRSYEEIFQQLGVPSEGGPAVPMGVELMLTPEEKELAPKYKPAAIAGNLAEMVLGGKSLDLALKGASKVAEKIVDPTERLVQAIGLTGKQIKEGIQKGEKSTKNIENIVGMAKKEGIVTPFTSTGGILSKTKKRLNEIGSQIGDMIDETGNKFLQWQKTAKPSELEDYVNAGLNFTEDKPMILERIRDQIGLRESSPRVLERTSNYIDLIQSKIGNQPTLSNLQKLKSELGKQIKDFGKNQNELPEIKQAYLTMLDVVDEKIGNLISFGEKINTGADLAKFKNLKRQYATLSEIEKGAVDKAARELRQPFNPMEALRTPFTNTRSQTAIAALPGAIGPGPATKGLNVLRSIRVNEPTYEGFKESQTQKLSLPEGAQIFELDLKNNSMLTPTQKASRLNLLRKHGRIYIGQ